MYSEHMNPEEEAIWRAQVKAQAILDKAMRLITEKHHEKFFFAPTIDGSFNGQEEITLVGDFNILKTELHQEQIEYDGEKKTYNIILRSK